MKCNKCGNEFEGKFCPECGTAAENQQVFIQNDSVPISDNKNKKKKPFYKKWWFILIVIIVVIAVAGKIFGGNSKNNNMSKSNNSSVSDAEEFDWSSFSLSDKLPEPKSTKGTDIYDESDSLSLTVCNTTAEDYDKYVSECEKKFGFTIEKIKTDSWFSAENSEKYSLDISFYEDDSTMDIYLYYDGENKNKKTTASTTTTKVTTTESVAETENDSTGISKEFKEAMDSYEEFMDEYVEFMKKYKSDPSDLTILKDYSTYMSKYAQVCEDFENWENEDLNDEELAYYIDVQSRVSKKLLEVS